MTDTDVCSYDLLDRNDELLGHLDIFEKRNKWQVAFRLSDTIEIEFILQANCLLPEGGVDAIPSLIESSLLEDKLAFIRDNIDPRKTYKKSFTIHSADTIVTKLNGLIEDWHEKVIARIERNRELDLFESMVAEKPYHTFMRGSFPKRKVTCFIAPTNSGKSYLARQRLIQLMDQDLSAVLLPLRALALENQQDFIAQGIPANLVTGEEQNYVQDALITCQTVETFRSQQRYNVVMVDEAQLVLSESRGSAYLEALCAAQCDHLILTASPESRQALVELFDLMGEEIEFIESNRLCPLKPLDRPMTYDDIQRGDLIVTFSVKRVHEIASLLSDLGFRTGTIYGAMSPIARRKMMNRYFDGKIDVMVSTDAIGLGCNCPVDRVLFADIEKFDGYEVRLLQQTEFKQIAGRAGRFGYSKEGHYGVLESALTRSEAFNLVTDAVEGELPTEPLQALYAMPNKMVFKASPLPLMETLNTWLKATCSHELYRLSDRLIEDMHRRIRQLEHHMMLGQISKSMAIDLLFVAFNYDHHEEYFAELIVMIHKDRLIPASVPGRASLQDLELVAERLSILSQLSQIVPHLVASPEVLFRLQKQAGDQIYKRLKDMYAKHTEQLKRA